MNLGRRVNLHRGELLGDYVAEWFLSCFEEKRLLEDAKSGRRGLSGKACTERIWRVLWIKQILKCSDPLFYT